MSTYKVTYTETRVVKVEAENEPEARTKIMEGEFEPSNGQSIKLEGEPRAEKVKE